MTDAQIWFTLRSAIADGGSFFRLEGIHSQTVYKGARIEISQTQQNRKTITVVSNK